MVTWSIWLVFIPSRALSFLCTLQWLIGLLSWSDPYLKHATNLCLFSSPALRPKHRNSWGSVLQCQGCDCNGKGTSQCPRAGQGSVGRHKQVNLTTEKCNMIGHKSFMLFSGVILECCGNATIILEKISAWQ